VFGLASMPSTIDRGARRVKSQVCDTAAMATSVA
jgi:hypothetical protein